MSIVNRLFEIRTQRSLTQEQVAVLTGVSRVTVGRIDRDPHYRPKGKTMQDLARGLRLRIGDLFDNDEVTAEPVMPSAHPFRPEPAAPAVVRDGGGANGRDLIAAGVTRVAVGAGVGDSVEVIGPDPR
jgi:DNA-binding XRE family transcriptional regulator